MSFGADPDRVGAMVSAAQRKLIEQTLGVVGIGAGALLGLSLVVVASTNGWGMGGGVADQLDNRSFWTLVAAIVVPLWIRTYLRRSDR